MRLLALGFCVLLSASASAMEADRQNVFKADLSNSDLEQAVTAFENVCLPFVWHTTELTHAANVKHNQDLITRQGYDLRVSKVTSEQMVTEPARHEWRPPSQAVIEGVDTVVMQTGEVDMMSGYIPAKYRTVEIRKEAYVSDENARLTAYLGWSIAPQKRPGKSCEVHITSPSLTEADFLDSLIEKDSDWAIKGEWWSQCVSQADDIFLFTVQHSADALSVRMKRNGFYEDDPCKTQIKSMAGQFGR